LPVPPIRTSSCCCLADSFGCGRRRLFLSLGHSGASGYPLDPADVARLTPLGHPTINLDGRYRTTSRPPATGLRPLRID
jgi:hypothetical protein